MPCGEARALCVRTSGSQGRGLRFLPQSARQHQSHVARTPGRPPAMPAMPQRIPRSARRAPLAPRLPDQRRVHPLPRSRPRFEFGRNVAAMKGAIMGSPYRFIRLAPFALLLLAAQQATLRAQNSDGDGYEAPPIRVAGFNTQGSVTFGYRFADIKGYQPMYMELLDLRRGPRLMDFNMFGEAAEKANPFADNFSLSLSGLGGDPFPTAQLSVTKNKLYDFRANWRQSYYNWNQNDNVVLPIASAAPGLGTGLTDNHKWATVRKFGSADFTLHATNRLRFNFNYYRPTDDGPT